MKGIMSNAESLFLPLIQFPQASVGVEQRRRQRFCPTQCFWFTQPLPCRAPTAEDRQTTAQSNDLAPRSSFRRIRPAADALIEVEENRHYVADVTPITEIVCLNEKRTAGHERSMHQDEKTRRDQTQVNLAWFIIRLGMVAVDLGGAVRRQIALQQAHSITDSETDIG